ncbi:MAG TPA: cytochrome c biogenesis protein CcsA, partial [Gemmataceae bacterium]|nr:cytochrome c biogenesis protein CcsA [Gemmataceae bacterium]
MNRITILCFGASYAVALLLELLQLFWPRRIQRYLALGFAGAGLLAHTLFLLAQPLALASEFWSVVFLAWILSIFYLYGSIHHRRLAWGVFVLPIVLGLTALAATFGRPDSQGSPQIGWTAVRGESLWIAIHIGLLVLAAVGICVGFVSSVMYLLQARRLRTKTLPGTGLRLLSLERLESMNRRAIT